MGMDFVFKVQWLRDTALPAEHSAGAVAPQCYPHHGLTQTATAELPQLCSLDGLLGFFPSFTKNAGTCCSWMALR